jgi:hypothetical protein
MYAGSLSCLDIRVTESMEQNPLLEADRSSAGLYRVHKILAMYKFHSVYFILRVSLQHDIREILPVLFQFVFIDVF